MINYLYYSVIFLLENITEKLYTKIENIDTFFVINYFLAKKFLKNPEQIIKVEKKLDLEDFQDKISESNDKFISWFLG